MKQIITTLIMSFIAFGSFAQMPICDTGTIGYVYIKAGDDIYQYNTITDTTIPISGVQIYSPNSLQDGEGLSVMPITNGFQTDYTWATTLKDSSSSPIRYATYDNINSQWNYHDPIPSIGAVNIGNACGTGMFNFDALLGFVYSFDSTASSPPIVSNLKATASSNSNKNGMFDVVGDIDGNFYILITTTQAPVPRGLHKYDPSGNLLHSWTISGIHTNYGAGLAIVDNKVYALSGSNGLWIGTLAGNNVHFTQSPYAFRGCPVLPFDISDLASCPNMPAFGSTISTLRPNCSGNQAPLSTSNYLNNFEILGLSPNPAINIVSLEVNSNKNDDLNIEILNLNGQKMLTTNYSINSGNNVLKLENLDFASGIYLLRVTNKNKIAIVRKIAFR